MRVDLMITCLNDVLFPKTGIATVKILERLGHEVAFDPRQTCCGQMHFNSGDQQSALSLIRRTVEIFQNAVAVVSPSGSCVAMIRDLYPKAADWAGDDLLLAQTRDLASRCFELSEFLVIQLGMLDVGAFFPHRVVYHPSCHAKRVLEVGDAPLQLLRQVKDLELLELPDADQCCGFGGTFSVKNVETSEAMLQDKIASVLSRPSYACTAGDNSCLMHIGGGLSRQGSPVKVIHYAEILASTEREPYG